VVDDALAVVVRFVEPVVALFGHVFRRQWLEVNPAIDCAEEARDIIPR
jgi:hypothetical protein